MVPGADDLSLDWIGALPGAVILTDGGPDGPILAFNAELLALCPTACPGALLGDVAPLLVQAWNAARAQSGAVAFEVDLQGPQVVREFEARPGTPALLLTRARRAEIAAPSDAFERVFRKAALPMGILHVPELVWVDVNDAWTATYGYTRDDVVGRNIVDLGFWVGLPSASDLLQQLLQEGELKRVTITVRAKDGRLLRATLSTSLVEIDGQLCSVTTSEDMTERLRLEEEHERLLDQIAAALAKVKSLSGMLPICMCCKSIRDDDGYWQRLEKYIAENSDAVLTHGVCPSCHDKYYPEAPR